MLLLDSKQKKLKPTISHGSRTPQLVLLLRPLLRLVMMNQSSNSKLQPPLT